MIRICVSLTCSFDCALVSMTRRSKCLRADLLIHLLNNDQGHVFNNHRLPEKCPVLFVSIIDRSWSRGLQEVSLRNESRDILLQVLNEISSRSVAANR